MRLLSTEFFESIQKMGIYSESVFRCFNSNESKNFTPDVTKSALKSGDFLILGTDGVINEALTIPEIAEYIRANPNQNEEELREKIFKTMSRKIKQKHESEDKKIKTITKEGSEVELHTSFVSSDNMSLIVFKMD